MMSNIELLLNDLKGYYDKFYDKNNFNGPSLFLHREAVLIDIKKDFEEKCKRTYAVLPAWGMHRMGDGGPNMQEYEIYRDSLFKLKSALLSLAELSYSDINDSYDEIIKEIFSNMKVMNNKKILVGNSKVLCHLLPKIFGPIDNRYTLKFAGINNNSDKVEKQFTLFNFIQKEVYYKIVSDPRFQNFYKTLKNEKWDTSELKVADNLIIGFIGSQK